MTTDTIGSTQATNTGASQYILLSKVTASASGILQSIGLNISSNPLPALITVGIYSDSGGGSGGGTLLSQSASTTGLVGFNDYSVASINIASSTIYWLAFINNNDNLVWYNQMSGGDDASYAYATNTYASGLPSTAPSVVVGNPRILNMRMTYAAPTSTLNNWF